MRPLLLFPPASALAWFGWGGGPLNDRSPRANSAISRGLSPQSRRTATSRTPSASARLPSSRTSPQLDVPRGVLGTQRYALVVALNATTGAVLAAHQLHAHPLALVTQSPTWHAATATLLVGVSSIEHIAVMDEGYVCCSFYGLFAAVGFDAERGKFEVQWTVPTIPAARRAGHRLPAVGDRG